MKKEVLVQVIFALTSVAYLGLMAWTPFAGDWVIKMIPALSLGAWALFALEGKLKWLLATAMVFSAGGDVALAMVPKGMEDFFIVGLGSFLVAQAIYVALFLQHRKFQMSRIWAIVLVLGLGITMAVLLFPKLGELKVPVMVYLTVIAAMAISAALNSRGGLLLVFGAITFMISDATIATNKFLLDSPVPELAFVIMVTYFAAQYMIARAVITAPGESSS